MFVEPKPLVFIFFVLLFIYPIYNANSKNSMHEIGVGVKTARTRARAPAQVLVRSVLVVAECWITTIMMATAMMTTAMMVTATRTLTVVAMAVNFSNLR